MTGPPPKPRDIPRLPASEIERMRREHVKGQSGYPQYPPNCAKCYDEYEQAVAWPCDASLLLDELEAVMDDRPNSEA